MATADGTSSTADEDGEATPTVTVARSSPDRTVFIEDDNSDGWIATDVTVELER